MLFCATYFDDAQLADLYSAMAPNMEAVAGDAIAATQRGYYAAARAYGVGTGDYLEIGPDVRHVVRSVAEGSFGHLHLFEPNRAVHPQGLAAEIRQRSRDHTWRRFRTDQDRPCRHDPRARPPDRPVGDACHRPSQAAWRRHAAGRHHNEASLLRRIRAIARRSACNIPTFDPATMAGMMQRVGYRDCSVSRSVNHFPIDFLARQAFEAGIHLRALPLPSRSIALRLGNILALARKPDHPAAAKLPLPRQERYNARSVRD
jgi:hypothetical protein